MLFLVVCLGLGVGAAAAGSRITAMSIDLEREFGQGEIVTAISYEKGPVLGGRPAAIYQRGPADRAPTPATCQYLTHTGSWQPIHLRAKRVHRIAEGDSAWYFIYTVSPEAAVRVEHQVRCTAPAGTRFAIGRPPFLPRLLNQGVLAGFVTLGLLGALTISVTRVIRRRHVPTRSR
ncbi:hypothetical protein DPM19_09940 [Actinomadura craniellae]|uniref:DUF3592 domain-containing protein n=2 Tax=Actinomadura craniellae TaxID=2231787 RepID=A0A365H7F6_9ACTN|nr:hypothetical protein DPM19_09940 [Actinomadura craniellae]